MAHQHGQISAHGPAHGHVHGHEHAHCHAHGIGAHPAQAPLWSIFRMSMPTRLGAAIGVSAILWALTLAAMA